MFPRSAWSFVLLFLFSGLLLACQGDQGVPSEPDRGLELAGACKNEAYSNAVPLYKSSKVQSALLQECKRILGLTDPGQAELAVDALLVGVFQAYNLTPDALQPLAGETLPASVAIYIEAACGLVSLSDDECLTPNDVDENGSIGENDLGGYLAVGPLTSSGTTLATALTPNGLFAVGAEEAQGAYVFVSQRPPEDVDGPCPGPSPNDCQRDVWDVDVDGVLTSLTVESCNSFGERHMRCPPGQDCEFGDEAPALNLVTDEACTAAGYAMMSFWGRFAFNATRPAQWIVRATPAYAGVGTKFEGWSPIVAADLDLRRRGVDCTVTSQFNAGSEGTICRIFEGPTQLDSCETVAEGSNSSTCTLNPLVPDDITVFVTAEKTGGSGAFNATSENFTLGPADPAWGDPNKEVCFEMTPPSAIQVDCP